MKIKIIANKIMLTVTVAMMAVEVLLAWCCW